MMIRIIALILFLLSSQVSAISEYKVKRLVVNKLGVDAYTQLLQVFDPSIGWHQRWMGYFYDRGVGTQNNPELAYKHYFKAFSLDDVGGAIWLLDKLHPEKDRLTIDAIMSLVQKNIASEHVDSKVAAELLSYIDPKSQSAQVIFDLAVKASSVDSAKAHMIVGEGYEMGIVINRDLVKAKAAYEKAGKLGEHIGYFHIGRLLHLSAKTQSEYKQAFDYYNKAKKANDPNVFGAIGQLYEHGHGVKKNLEMAYNYYKKAEQSGAGWASDWAARAQSKESSPKMWGVPVYGSIVSDFESIFERSKIKPIKSSEFIKIYPVSGLVNGGKFVTIMHHPHGSKEVAEVVVLYKLNQELMETMIGQFNHQYSQSKRRTSSTRISRERRVRLQKEYSWVVNNTKITIKPAEDSFTMSFKMHPYYQDASNAISQLGNKLEGVPWS
jgi:TPR repeat protein